MDHTEAFTECWHRDAPRVLRYARRHTVANDAPDVVADTFAIAWRKWADVPDPPIGWLLRTAMGVIRNRERSNRRRHTLDTRVGLLGQAASGATDTADAVIRRDEALRRLAALTDDQREAVLLTAWDGLSPDEAAGVLGIKPATFRKRVSRARELLEQDESPPATHQHSAKTAPILLSQETS
jgi:RNA polymerase sigma-70 factor (ECF subfamily)